MDKFDVDGLTVRIEQDTDPPNPRKEFDQAAHMICFHRRYNLGDKHEWLVDAAKIFAENVERNGGVVLPLYLYDHSGITMNTTGFSCPWDSGQVGFIYMERKDILNNWGGKRVTKKRLEDARNLMIAEVKEYDMYLRGDVYGYIIEDPDGNHLDSCWGFFGEEYCREAATESAKHAAELYNEEKRKEEMEYGAAHNA